MNNPIISTLNDIIETCKDGEEGFRTCAENVQDGELQGMFRERSQRCAEEIHIARRHIHRGAFR